MCALGMDGLEQRRREKMAIARCFSENLLSARRRSGLSQEELGYRANLHRTEVGLLERGARLPQIDTVLKLAGALEVKPEILLAGMDWQVGTVEAGGFEVGGGG